MAQKLVFNTIKTEQPNTPAESWNILIVDDDVDVHEATVFALKGEIILGKSLEFFHAYTGEEGLEKIKTIPDLAIILMDVVMETKTSGLEAIQTIREELDLHMVRIILSTGQPGDAPELDTIHRYDINDYKTKSELTRNKLMTTVITAIRSYSQLQIIEDGKAGLEKIINANSQFRSDLSLESFGTKVLLLTSSLFHLPLDGFICRTLKDGRSDRIRIIASSGSFKEKGNYQSGL
ncbi:DUF3369 domain-containing protein [Oceanispirochaeta sp.]|uniref:response regulator n=1 Tax=Oceanispirochaeta sp. TaxID=2035350 RepID=UPI002611008C|nr:DUF3369 domain-containing protein [Oceanispirochaeta sp.]MDA3956285.1 DUF3369 domain-containing protein [Oceanispirochaeta sp.]